MAKRPEERYPGCRELAEELRRFLNDEPISRRPLSLLERLRRWCRRERALATATACGVAIFAVLLAAILGVGFGIVEAKIVYQRDTALKEKDNALDEKDNALGIAERALAEASNERDAAKKAKAQTEVALGQVREALGNEARARKDEVEARKIAEQTGQQLKNTLERVERGSPPPQVLPGHQDDPTRPERSR